jgi:hypothetical protein
MRKFSINLSKSARVLLLNKFIDLCIVIVGVSVAFQLNNLKQSSDGKALEKFYLTSLVQDVQADIDQMRSIEKKLQADHRLVNAVVNFPNSPIDTVARAVFEVLSFETFNTRHDNAYRSIVNSGTAIIHDEELLMHIQDYYKSYANIDRFEKVYTDYIINHFHPYFSSRFDYRSQKFVKPESLNETDMGNNLLVVSAVLNDGIESYKEALRKADFLAEKLAKK